MRQGGRASSGRVLIVEDEFLVCEMIADMVAILGYRVSGRAFHLATARRALGAGNFDCVLLDIRLGGDLTLEIADVLIERGVPFAFVTGYSGPFEPRHATTPVLYKPFSLIQLRGILRRLIGPAPAKAAHRRHAG